MVVAFGAVAADLLDVVENAPMLAYLSASTGGISLARVMAIPKFVLVLIAIVYILIGIVALIVRRVRTLA